MPSDLATTTPQGFLIELESLVQNYNRGFSISYFDNDVFGSEYGFLNYYRNKAEELMNLIDDFKDNFTENEIKKYFEDTQ